MTIELLKIFMALVFVIGLIVLGSRLIINRASFGQNQILKTIGFLNLGPRKSIAVVKAGKEIMLLAITSNDIKLLKTYPEDNFDKEITNLKENIRLLQGMKESLRRDLK